MARRIGEVTPRSTYPWSRWADGSAWQITRGRDFEVEPATMRSVIHTHARRLGRRVSTSVRGDRVQFQFEGAGDVVSESA